MIIELKFNNEITVKAILFFIQLCYCGDFEYPKVSYKKCYPQ